MTNRYTMTQHDYMILQQVSKIDDYNPVSEKEFNELGFVNMNLIDRYNRKCVLIEMSKLPNSYIYSYSTYFEDLSKYLYKILKEVGQKEYVIIYNDQESKLPFSLFSKVLKMMKTKSLTNLYRVYCLLPSDMEIKVKVSCNNHVFKYWKNKIVVIDDLYDLYENFIPGALPFDELLLEKYSKFHKIFGLPLSEVKSHSYRKCSSAPIVVETTFEYLSIHSDCLFIFIIVLYIAIFTIMSVLVTLSL